MGRKRSEVRRESVIAEKIAGPEVDWASDLTCHGSVSFFFFIGVRIAT
jgi:hypothetical protein